MVDVNIIKVTAKIANKNTHEKENKKYSTQEKCNLF